ncbi:hypothetical protein F480_07630 [Bibersteinia trehalosi Y31]|uniref:Uncharacterized protein n=1 Tax=Bibersteinia trehalosi Y31 TaxID=1261658 RepID=A0A179CYD2_BIBTR|nr:hypothetical protein F480_07630 [Bibersteinia trehalosi Y31]
MPYMHSSFIYRKDNNYFDSLEHKFAETANRLTTTMSGLPNIVNTVSFSTQPNSKLDANSDAVIISRSRKAIVNKHTLNQHSDPASVAKSSIITDDMRVLIKTRSNLLNS